jgi:GGDEF domain-containing protein
MLEPYLKEVTAEMRRTGTNKALFVRISIGILAIVWITLFSPSFLYHLTLSSLFIVIGLGYYTLANSKFYAMWMAYLLLLIDSLLLSMALFYYPEAGIFLTYYLSGTALVCYFILLILSILSYSPSLVAWATIINISFWFIGISSLLGKYPSIFSFNNLFLQAMLLLFIGGILASVLRQIRDVMYQQILREREFYDILISDRDNIEGVTPYIDDLTGLGNFSAFKRDSEQFTKVFAEGRLSDLTIAFIDVTGSKSILVKHGEIEYEKMMKCLADGMCKSFRSSDLVYRIDEEQFALLAPGATIHNTDRLKCLLKKSLKSVHELGFDMIDATMGLSTLDEAEKN